MRQTMNGKFAWIRRGVDRYVARAGVSYGKFPAYQNSAAVHSYYVVIAIAIAAYKARRYW